MVAMCIYLQVKGWHTNQGNIWLLLISTRNEIHYQLQPQVTGIGIIVILKEMTYFPFPTILFWDVIIRMKVNLRKIIIKQYDCVCPQ